MIAINCSALLLGFGSGLLLSTLFFCGLHWGMRVALRSNKPTTVLLSSALCRITVLLAGGYAATALSGTGWAALGYAAGFFVVRLIAIVWARPAPESTLP